MPSVNFPVLQSDFPNLSWLVGAVVEAWPEHENFLALRFADAEDTTLPTAEKLAGLIRQISGDAIAEYCKNYKSMCGNLMREEIHFRKTGTYRLSTLKQAYDEFYSRPEYMEPYLNGLLLSQVLWRNQSAAIGHFAAEFLPSIPPGKRYLEIGPGHGLFLYFAAQSSRFSALHGWDISQTSLNETRHALESLGVNQDVNLQTRDILSGDVPCAEFDAVVISEVLEHLEHPKVALGTLHQALVPGGTIFINVPVNSPAPDHIYLWRTPEDVVALVEECGFEIRDVAMEPMTGYDLETARRRKLTISVVITAVRR